MASLLQEQDWRALVLSITQGDCILMLGPDAVKWKIDGKAVPLMQLFANHLKGRLEAKTAVAPEFHFSQVAQAFKNQFGGLDLKVAAEEFFQPKEEAPHQALLDLAALPFRLVINTTPGTQMEEAFRRSDKDPRSDWYSFKGAPKEMVYDGTEKAPLVYHLYGCIHDLKSLVLAEDDLLDFLVAVVSRNPPLPNNIRSVFQSKENCFLFLGFGLKHWYLRILLHVRYRGGGENRSFALETFDDTPNPVSVERTKSFFQEGHKIYFFEMDLDAFAAELRRRVEGKREAQVREGEQAVRMDAPRVFLCHASEDKTYAANLREKLNREGFKPWLDVEAIRGGDLWSNRIERTITDEIDYFLVLQSNALIAKDVGYVNKEIMLAIERSKYYRGRSFIFPVLIEKCEKLPELEHFQSIDLTQAGGLDTLLKDIKRDYQIRKKRS